jgi:hypothetical protein
MTDNKEEYILHKNKEPFEDIKDLLIHLESYQDYLYEILLSPEGFNIHLRDIHIKHIHDTYLFLIKNLRD